MRWVLGLSACRARHSLAVCGWLCAAVCGCVQQFAAVARQEGGPSRDLWVAFSL